jgi:outer membrane immunogenic protein
MKTYLLAAAAIILAATPTLASDADGKSDFQGFYAGLVTGVSPLVEGYDPAWAGGVTLGYNWNVADSVIIGIEGDLMAGTWEGFGYANDSIRLRAGYDLDGFLVYATAGYGATALSADFGGFTASAAVAGIVGGGGIEVMMGSNTSIKLEGLYRGETESFEVRTGLNFNF